MVMAGEQRAGASLFGRTLQRSFQSFFGAVLQLVVNANVKFPDEIVELWGLAVQDHRGALKVLDERAIAEARQLLNKQLVEVVTGNLLGAFVQKEKILDLPGMRGLIGQVLLHHHYGRKDQNRYGE